MEKTNVDPRSGIRLVGEPVSYADGSEDAVLAVLERAGDRSAASDELAGHISDWPSRYHFSRLRPNLLRPLTLAADLRVLDVGAGSGTLARYLGETGARVVALEGSLPRARAAAARVEALPGVEVVCGPLEAFADEDGFDLVLCVGVLEYAGDPQAFLSRLRSLTRPTGALVLAIENQLGLKYLLGYGEDHLGQPWAGVEGYPGSTGPQTYSRRRLGQLLASAGFGSQRWLFPFPDYKLPSAVLDEQAYREPDALDFVDQIVRWPCSPLASAPARVCDDRRAHRVFVDAGLGPDVANSFLVVAGAHDEIVARTLDSGRTAWLFGGDRRRLWQATKAFGADEVNVDHRPGQRGPSQHGWLRQVRPQAQPRVRGRTVEQLALEACGAGAEAVGEVLRRWRNHLRDLETEAEEDFLPLHPFRAQDSRRLLPETYLDVDLPNFVDGVDGDLHYVDAEWVAPGGVDAGLVCARALWWFAADLVVHGVIHPWPGSCSVDELAEALGLACGSAAGPEVLARWRPAEAELHAKVTGLSVDVCQAELLATGAATQQSPAVMRHLPFTTLRRSLADSSAGLADLSGRLDTALGSVGSLTASLEAETRWRSAVEQRVAVRLYRRFRRLTGPS